MADTRAGLEVEEFHLGRRYSGSPSALIAAGVAAAEQFPGQPGCGKTSTVFAVGGRKVRVTRRGPQLFDVVVRWTKEERSAYDARQAKYLAAREQERAAEQARAAEEVSRRAAEICADLLREALAESGPRRVAEASLEAGICSLIRAFNMLSAPDVPYTFDAATVELAKEHCQALCALFKDGKLLPQLGALAQSDGAFQRFMKTASGQQAKP